MSDNGYNRGYSSYNDYYSNNRVENTKFNGKDIIFVSPKQLKEIYAFYLSLGLSTEQAKKLTNRVFNFDVIAHESVAYSINWTFTTNSNYQARTQGASYGYSSYSNSYGGYYNSNSGYTYSDSYGAYYNSSSGYSYSDSYSGSYSSGDRGNGYTTSATYEVDESRIANPLTNPKAIFSANVNSASWLYVRNAIKLKNSINSDFIRIEELINSYDYRLNTPSDSDLFATTVEYGKCPWKKQDDILLFGLKGCKFDEPITQNLALLIDVSGSMSDNWLLAQMAIMSVVSKLKKGDHISIIAYSNQTTTVVENMDCGDMDACIDKILSVVGIGGGTNGSDGLTNAYKYLKKHYDEKSNNRVLIFTDGDFNFGITDGEELSEFIYKKRKTGIYLSVIGFGFDNYQDDNMEYLARKGNGNYCLIGNPEDIGDYLDKKLTSSLITIAKDVKISIELNPMYVSKYRLIGYDARVLSEKEFSDDSAAVDGVGSEHSIIALLQIRRGEAQPETESRYQTTVLTNAVNEFAYVTINYKTRTGESKSFERIITLDDLSAKTVVFDQAMAMAMFGLVLKNSEYKGTCTTDSLEKYVTKLVENKVIDEDAPSVRTIGMYLEYLKNAQSKEHHENDDLF